MGVAPPGWLRAARPAQRLVTGHPCASDYKQHNVVEAFTHEELARPSDALRHALGGLRGGAVLAAIMLWLT